MQAPLQERADWYHRGWEANAQATLNQLCTTARTTQAIQHATTTESRALLLLTNAGHWSDHHSELTPTHPIRKLNVRFFHRDRYSLSPPNRECLYCGRSAVLAERMLLFTSTPGSSVKISIAPALSKWVYITERGTGRAVRIHTVLHFFITHTYYMEKR